jgi:hypothetical protein
MSDSDPKYYILNLDESENMIFLENMIFSNVVILKYDIFGLHQGKI